MDSTKIGSGRAKNAFCHAKPIVLVLADRAESYDVAERLLRPEVVRVPVSKLIAEGNGMRVGVVDVAGALQDLFKVETRLREWNRREYSWDRVARESDVDSKAVFRKHSTKERRARSRKRFEDWWIHFANKYGTLVGEQRSHDFGRYATDLTVWAQHVSGTLRTLLVEKDSDVTRLAAAAALPKLQRVRAALETVHVEGNTVKCPTLYAALAFALTEQCAVGIRFSECANPACQRTFIHRRRSGRYCSAACRKRSNRRKRA